jgi:hypothetical protein
MVKKIDNTVDMNFIPGGVRFYVHVHVHVRVQIRVYLPVEI